MFNSNEIGRKKKGKNYEYKQSSSDSFSKLDKFKGYHCKLLLFFKLIFIINLQQQPLNLSNFGKQFLDLCLF